MTPTPAPTFSIVAKVLEYIPVVSASMTRKVSPQAHISLNLEGRGTPFTVNTMEAAQPLGIVYLIIVVPPTRPDTMPDVDPIVATDAVAEVHTPPVVRLPSVLPAPMHAYGVPVMFAGVGSTVTLAIALHPEPRL